MAKGSSFVGRLKILEQGSETAPGGSSSCGRYRLSMAPTVKFHREGSASSGLPTAVPVGGWEQGPPSQFGLTLAIDDPYASLPNITITHNQASTAVTDLETLVFRMTVILSYESSSGASKELCRAEQEVRAMGLGQFMRDVADCVVASIIDTRWVGPWEEVESIRDQIRTVDLFRAVHSSRVSDAQRGSAYFSRVQALAGQVMYISPGGSSRRTSLQEAKITVSKTSDPRVVSIRSSAGTPIGRYVILFGPSTGRQSAPETMVVVNVAR